MKSPTFILIREEASEWLLVLAAFALRVASRQLPDYSSPNSPRRFTQPQLLACIVLKPWLGDTYRSVAERLERSPRLRAVLGLRSVPHYTTLKRFRDRIPGAEDLRGHRNMAYRRMARFAQRAVTRMDV